MSSSVTLNIKVLPIFKLGSLKLIGLDLVEVNIVTNDFRKL